MDQDYSEFLTAEARSGNAAFHEFRLLYDGAAIHTFFEGENDGLFYITPIRRQAGERIIHSYICDGKDGVLRAYGYISDAGYSSEGCLFFIDRDYDDLFGEQPPIGEEVYLTDCYSVENMLVSMDAAEIVVSDFCGFSRADPEYRLIMEAVSVGIDNSRLKLLPLIAWALALRERGTPPNFANVDLKKIFHVDDRGRVTKRPGGIARFHRACAGSAAKPSHQDIKRWLNLLRPMAASVWCRGKFELWFFETVLLSAVTAAVPVAKARGKKRARVALALRQRQTFDMLGARLEVPRSVDAYIRARVDRLAA